MLPRASIQTVVNNPDDSQDDSHGGVADFRQNDRWYHPRGNNYRFDVVQIYCFRINIKL